MTKPAFVLQALKIIGPEEILKLSEIVQEQQLPMKKAAGEELIVWDDTPEVHIPRPKDAATEAKVLPFPKARNETAEPEHGTKLDLKELVPAYVPAPEAEEPIPNFLSSDEMLWHRELAKENEPLFHKGEAFKGYKKSNEMYVVKTQLEGKEKIRFAATRGVLINKKQA